MACPLRCRHGSRLAVRPNHARHQLSRKRLNALDPKEWEGIGGDPEVQEALAQVLRVEVRKQKDREEVETEFQLGVDKLREVAEEAKEEMDKIAKLNKLRATLAFDMTLADIMQDAEEFEAQLKKSREEMEASERDLAQFEHKTNVDRSQGLFFQNLYQSDSSVPVGTPGAPLSPEAQQAVDVVKQPATQEVESSFRLMLFTYMTVVLGFLAIQDVLSEAPSYPIDAAYASLAFFIGYHAWNERKALAKLVDADNKQDT